jgi:hypothetical protein
MASSTFAVPSMPSARFLLRFCGLPGLRAMLRPQHLEELVVVGKNAYVYHQLHHRTYRMGGRAVVQERAVLEHR